MWFLASLALCCSVWKLCLPDTCLEEPQRKGSRQKDVHVKFNLYLTLLDLTYMTMQWWVKPQSGRRIHLHVSTRHSM